MGQARRRKSKGGSRSSTPTPSLPSSENETKDDNTNDAKIETSSSLTNDTEKKDSSKTNDEKIDPNPSLTNDTEKKDSSKPVSGENVVRDEDSLLVLTSEKRRGVYECDYCHADISQQPRIRCAASTDFDLCLDCFVTSDHEAMAAKAKSNAETQAELKKDGIASVGVAAISSEAWPHKGYRVCDSTRYPLFPSGRIVNEKIAAMGQDETNTSSNNVSFRISLPDDPKTMWTAEEDLRLIDAISTHGLGNWVDISEAIGGQGSVGKTPKRCMERYLDDFMGRYGHIVPQWTIVDDTIVGSNQNATNNNSGEVHSTTNNEGDNKLASTENDKAVTNAMDTTDDGDKNENEKGKETSQTVQDKQEKEGDQAVETSTGTSTTTSTNIPTSNTTIEEEEGVRTSKRRISASGLGGASMTGGRSSSRKKYKVVPTESLPSYKEIWPHSWLPKIKGVKVGQEVARDLSYKAELSFVKSTLAASSKEEADKVHQTWKDTRFGRIGGPTVLPPRPQDAVHLVGSELAGFMPRRGDFDVEWENDAEAAIADMEFVRGDTPEDRELKLKVLQIYNEKLDEREKRKKFVLNRHLFDYRQYVQNDLKIPMDERDLIHRMRLFERFHTPDEHKKFILDILKAKRLRKEIAKLQMYRRIGIRSMAEAEMYELDKDRRQFHKKMEVEAKAKAAAAASSKGTTKGGGVSSNLLVSGTSRTPSQVNGSDSLWKQYRTNDRKNRRNSNRFGNSIDSLAGDTTNSNISKATDESKKEDKETENETAADSNEVSGDNEGKKEDKETENDPTVAPKNVDGSKSQDDAMEIDVDNESKKEDKETENDPTVDPKNVDGSKGQDDAMEIDADNESKKEDKETENDPTIALKNIDGSKVQDDAIEKNAKDDQEFDISKAPCKDLLSRKELALCERQRLYPVQYLEIKKALIHESLINGLLDKDSSNSSKRTIVKIDVERRGNVVDFLVRAGWISRKLADVAKRVVTPPP